MGCKIAGGSDQNDGGCGRAARKLVVSKRCLDGLDRVEVAVLAQQRSPQHGQQSVRFHSPLQAVDDEQSGLVHALLAIEQVPISFNRASESLTVPLGSGTGFDGTLRNRSR